MTRDEFTALVRREQAGLRRLLTALCLGNSEEADDLAQETFLRAYEASARFVGEGSEQAWLRQIAWNCFLNSRRSSRPRQETELERAERLPADSEADAAFQYEALYHAIRQLSPTERTALLLHYMEDRPIAEIAQIMNVAEGTVKSALSRARNHLKLKLSRL